MSIVPQRIYNQVMMLDNFVCVYCGKRTADVQVDHIIPRNYGGPDTLHNLVACCPKCNMTKSDRQLHEAGMQLRFGRFTRPTRQKARRVVDLPVSQQIARPEMKKEERSAHVISMAQERDEHNHYRYSANAILKKMGGTAADVKALIAAVRDEKPAEQAARLGHLPRPINGWRA